MATHILASAPLRQSLRGVATLTLLGLIPGCGDGNGSNDPPPAIDGAPAWEGIQSLSAPASQISCTDQATFSFTQQGGTFTGSVTLSGICDTPAGLVDNSGTWPITNGRITNTNGPTSDIRFTIPGQPDCLYKGKLTVHEGTGAASASGAASCVGSGIDASGTWDMAR